MPKMAAKKSSNVPYGMLLMKIGEVARAAKTSRPAARHNHYIMKNRKITIYILIVFLGLAAAFAPIIIDSLQSVNFHRVAEDTMADARTWVAAISYICGVY